jgi:hypothetical protein
MIIQLIDAENLNYEIINVCKRETINSDYVLYINKITCFNYFICPLGNTGILVFVLQAEVRDNNKL